MQVKKKVSLLSHTLESVNPKLAKALKKLSRVRDELGSYKKLNHEGDSVAFVTGHRTKIADARARAIADGKDPDEACGKLERQLKPALKDLELARQNTTDRVNAVALVQAEVDQEVAAAKDKMGELAGKEHRAMVGDILDNVRRLRVLDEDSKALVEHVVDLGIPISKYGMQRISVNMDLEHVAKTLESECREFNYEA